MTFKPLKTGELDLGAFYAPKTQLDAHGRRILWGWIKEQRTDAAMLAAGWSGMMSLPRLLNLDPDGTLRIQTLPTISTLRVSKLRATTATSSTRITLPQSTGEVLCTAPADKDFSVTLSTPATELIRITYSAQNHAFTLDKKEFPLQPNDAPTLHAFVDGSVIELIAGGRIGYTKRFYYTESTAPDIVVVANGTASLDAWKIAPISKDRLTTPPRTA